MFYLHMFAIAIIPRISYYNKTCTPFNAFLNIYIYKGAYHYETLALYITVLSNIFIINVFKITSLYRYFFLYLHMLFILRVYTRVYSK